MLRWDADDPARDHEYRPSRADWVVWAVAAYLLALLLVLGWLILSGGIQ